VIVVIQKIKKHEIKECPECGSGDLFTDEERGEIVCNACGLVVEDSIVDTSQEWREFDSQQVEKRRRTGAPLSESKHDRGLSTTIGKGLSEIYELPAAKRSQYIRLRKWQTRMITATERNLKFALSELKRYVSYLNLPKNVEEATAILYRKAVDKGLVRGRSMESVIAGALYAACRQHNTPRTLEEISEVSRVSKREIGRAYRFISRELGMRVLPTKPTDYVPRFASELELPSEVRTKAIEILSTADKRELISGKGPTGVAAAALYLSSQIVGTRRTQRQVAEVAGVTEVTIRNRCKDLIDRLDLDVPSGRRGRRARRKKRMKV
jgi:transcription initiation factor TFIIB